MPQLQVMTHGALTPDLRARIVALCSAAYEEDFSTYFELLGTATHVLAADGGALVAHAAWVPRELRLGAQGTPLRCAYVEAVATQVGLQRRGLGTLVLRAIPPLVADFDIAALSPSEPDFYVRSGWEMWRGALRYLHGAQRVDTPDEQVMIHRLPRTPAGLDLAQPLEIDWRPCEVW